MHRAKIIMEIGLVLPENEEILPIGCPIRVVLGYIWGF